VDLLETHDQFYGAQVGASFCWHFYRITLDGSAKFAVGGTAQQIRSGGQTNVDAGFIEPSPGAPLVLRPANTLPGGLISSTPMTTTNRTRLSVLPEWRADLGYQITPNILAYIGYNFMWWSNVAIVGDQSSSSTTGTRDVWFQGLDFGVQVKY
jgi:Putative beta barrel porin-7 (BBP7)